MMYIWQAIIIFCIAGMVYAWLEYRDNTKEQRMFEERKKWLRYLKEKNDAGTD